MTAPSGQPRTDAGEMVERVTRAILVDMAEQVGAHVDADGQVNIAPPPGTLSFCTRRMARAATEAMREPTEAMVDAGVAKWIELSGLPSADLHLRGPCREIISAAIDTALREPAATDGAST